MPAAAAHTSPYSGSWYPDQPSELQELLDTLWQSSERRTGSFLLPEALGFVVPHAGLVYSGTVAAAAYRHVAQQQPQRIVLLGFAHRGCPPGIFIPDIECFRTPLGEVRVDRDCAEEILAHPLFRRMPESRLCDHSVEIQLPLLQKAAPDAQIVPLYIGHLDQSFREEAGGRLADWMQSGTVFLASSDLTHYGSLFHYQPFSVDKHTGSRLRELDYEVIEAAGSLRGELFLETLRETASTVCGYEPIALLLAALRHKDNGQEIFQEVLDYQTSGEITGDYHHSVSYGALGYFPISSFEITAVEQSALLEMARQALRSYQQTGQRIPENPTFLERHMCGLNRRFGGFVTLRKEEQLRGCLGRIAADQPLRTLIPELTLAAALEDCRFQPVAPSETGIEIEISLLSPMRRILQIEDFRVNVHGAFLKTKASQGLLLPQVATERNWNAAQFFDALVRKAGVQPAACSDPGTRLYVFRTQVIH
jgi:AmmeMemoRadiSam system protein B/AmmeMemoRadiSam system protein A